MTPGGSSLYGAISANGRGYSFLDNTTMTGLYAQAIGAATVVVERKFSAYPERFRLSIYLT